MTISRKAFLSDSAQMQVYEVALQSVVDFGYFRISAVIQDAKMQVSKGIILWKRIVREIERKLNVRMVPVAQSFFQGKRRNQVVNLLGENQPERHLATGRRDTAGYVSCGLPEAASIVEEKAARLEKIGTGFTRSAGDARCRSQRGQEAQQMTLLAAPA